MQGYIEGYQSTKWQTSNTQESAFGRAIVADAVLENPAIRRSRHSVVTCYYARRTAQPIVRNATVRVVRDGRGTLHVSITSEMQFPFLGDRMVHTEAKVHAPSWRAIISRRWCSASEILNKQYYYRCNEVKAARKSTREQQERTTRRQRKWQNMW